MIDKLLEKAVFTGSRAFTGDDTGTDYDYAMDVVSYGELTLYLAANGIKTGDSLYFIGVRFGYGTKAYNVFYLPYPELVIWRRATQLMIELCKDPVAKASIVGSKTTRIAVFELLRAVVKLLT